MTIGSKNTYSRKVNQCLETSIIKFILWLSEVKTKLWYFKRRLILEFGYTLYIFGYIKAEANINGKMTNKWFSDFPEGYFHNGILRKLNIEEFPKNKWSMVNKIINAVKEYYMLHNIKHTHEWYDFELYIFDNEYITNKGFWGFCCFGKYILINKKAMETKWNRQSTFLHEYCHYISKGGLQKLNKLDEGITEQIAFDIAIHNNMKYLLSNKYEKYYTVANFLICVDSQIRTAYLSSDDELKEKYMKDLHEIELALNGIGDLNQATEEYVDKKSHEL